MADLRRREPPDDDGLDPEGPSAEDLRRFGYDAPGEPELIKRCQECGHTMADDADLCPRCGAFQMPPEGAESHTSSGWFSRPAVVVGVVVLLLIAGWSFWPVGMLLHW